MSWTWIREQQGNYHRKFSPANFATNMSSACAVRSVDGVTPIIPSASCASRLHSRHMSVANVNARASAGVALGRPQYALTRYSRTAAAAFRVDKRDGLQAYGGHGGLSGYERRGRDGYRKYVTRASISKPKLQYTGNTNLIRASSLSSSGNASTSLPDGMSQDKPRLVSSLTAAMPPPPPISKSDAEFLDEMGIEFVWTTEELGIDELNNLFSQVGFPRRDPTRLAAALRNTHRSLWVRAARKSRLAKEGQLLAFGRATSDGALSATIWDVAVMPAWQRGGIGRGLVERLTRSIVEEGIPVVTLYAEPGVVGLYEKLGFEVDPAGVKGMAFQSSSRKGKGLLASI